MEIVIKIPDKLYETIISDKYGVHQGCIYDIIRDGTPLPKGHGRLIDVDDIRVIELEDSLHIIRHEKGDEVDVYIDAPTIIEADKAESEDKE